MSKISSITGFSDFSNYDFRGWNNISIRNLEILISALKNDKNTESVSNFISNLEKHLDTIKAHNLDITKYTDTLIENLYHLYREGGFSGSKQDMLLGFVKEVDIANSKDVDTGLSHSKIVTTYDWNRIFDKHQTNDLSHANLFKVYHPDNCFNSEVGFSLQTINKELWKNGYCLDSFNSKQGTLLLNFKHCKDTNHEIITFSNAKEKIILIDKNNHLYLNDIELISLPETTVSLPVVISLNHNSAVVRNDFEEREILNPFFEVTELSKISSHLHSLVYYVNSATHDEQTFLLN